MAHAYSHPPPPAAPPGCDSSPSTVLRAAGHGAWFQFTRERSSRARRSRLFNFGGDRRDFTYVDEKSGARSRGGARRVLGLRRSGIPWHRSARYRLYNIGNSQPVEADALHRGPREPPGPEGREEPAADAARRRPRHLRRRRRPDLRGGLPAQHAGGSRRGALRRLVPRLLRGQDRPENAAPPPCRHPSRNWRAARPPCRRLAEPGDACRCHGAATPADAARRPGATAGAPSPRIACGWTIRASASPTRPCRRRSSRPRNGTWRTGSRTCSRE